MIVDCREVQSLGQPFLSLPSAPRGRLRTSVMANRAASYPDDANDIRRWLDATIYYFAPEERLIADRALAHRIEMLEPLWDRIAETSATRFGAGAFPLITAAEINEWWNAVAAAVAGPRVAGPAIWSSTRSRNWSFPSL